MSPSRVSCFTKADTVDSFQFLYKEIGTFFGNAQMAVALAGILLGSKCLFNLGYNTLKFLHIYFFGSALSESSDSYGRTFGTWAVIFGATEDLGKDYVAHLATRGMNIVLVGDNETLLKKMLLKIEDEFLVKAAYILLETLGSVNQFRQVMEFLSDKNIGILVNNWGLPGASVPDIRAPIRLFNNTEIKLAFMILLNRYIVSRMVTEGRGAIITLTCSEADCIDSAYSPDLKYIHAFVQDQAKEFSKLGVIVQLYQPYRTGIVPERSWTDNYATSMIVPKSRWYAHQSMKVLGKSTVTSGYWTHSIFAGVYNLVPGWGKPTVRKHVESVLLRYKI